MDKQRRFAFILVVALTGVLLSVPSATNGMDVAVAEARRHHVRFVILNTNTNRPGAQQHPVLVAAFGAIHAQAKDKVLGPRKDKFVFRRGVGSTLDGNLIIRHKRHHQSNRFDRVNCYTSFRERGTWRVIRGTGDFANATGRGHYRVHATDIACVTPINLSVTIRAKGRLRLQ